MVMTTIGDGPKPVFWVSAETQAETNDFLIEAEFRSFASSSNDGDGGSRYVRRKITSTV